MGAHGAVRWSANSGRGPRPAMQFRGSWMRLPGFHRLSQTLRSTARLSVVRRCCHGPYSGDEARILPCRTHRRSLDWLASGERAAGSRTGLDRGGDGRHRPDLARRRIRGRRDHGHFTGLAAGRGAVLRGAGCDVIEHGLNGGQGGAGPGRSRAARSRRPGAALPRARSTGSRAGGRPGTNSRQCARHGVWADATTPRW